ncbi:30S ribosomal protein S17 [Desulfurivibrio alkaliphilus]|uniref:Small ribosomal subunit protein uS17 n=1 Tax=Desulfurivibrio alkaliphilus (strain DSM 19089 / UNIQEM U267 / AHT2) TaxID=589865 RepID=D6Z3L3_DESAT|nr:30S ribosomal protein S17 [Desulfurivibrio alkaliphilus]ADH86138.1 30S ribosomal protein S17 [Desulfurivibrio alkaliphilus AHT 2]
MSAEQQGSKKTRVGLVVSNKMDKSIVVQSTTMTPHKLYGKYIRSQTKCMAHDPENLCNVGDRVLVEECRPLSRRKRWRLRAILEKAV